jgi:2,4-dienoyl-CoA reductase-like NADH-dependent reductase (Old Yellow Enzyme family)
MTELFPHSIEYYGQRASVPGTLILAEGTFISPGCGGFPNGPGIWNEDQIEAWRAITDEVHRKGCFIFCQLFAMGRAADAETTRKEGIPILAPSAIPCEEGAPVPRPMTVEEIQQAIQDFRSAAKNAISAGFDGVECHGANGYLIDQFRQDVSNTRDDEYGGSVENRSRFFNDVEHPDKEIAVMFGRYFISNPDLVYRIKEGLKLSVYDRKTFYVHKSPVGYVDYPFSKEHLASVKA